MDYKGGGVLLRSVGWVGAADLLLRISVKERSDARAVVVDCREHQCSLALSVLQKDLSKQGTGLRLASTPSQQPTISMSVAHAT